MSSLRGACSNGLNKGLRQQLLFVQKPVCGSNVNQNVNFLAIVLFQKLAGVV